MADEQERLQEIIDGSDRIVFFGGAGVSTESGLPDFRSTDGLYNQHYPYPPETMLSRSFFDQRPEDFYRFYRDKMLILDAEPNAAHRKLAELEEKGKLTGIVTQNIDGLHQKAGSKKVYELHGSIMRNYCMDCGKSFSPEYVAQSEGVPRCDRCGGIVKPDVVLYEEPLNNDVVVGAIRAIEAADTMIVGGTSLVVYPAAGLLQYFQGRNLVLINRDSTPYDSKADLVLRRPIGEVLGAVRV